MVVGFVLVGLVSGIDVVFFEVSCDCWFVVMWFGSSLWLEGWVLLFLWDVVVGDYCVVDGWICLYINVSYYWVVVLVVLGLDVG